VHGHGVYPLQWFNNTESDCTGPYGFLYIITILPAHISYIRATFQLVRFKDRRKREKKKRKKGKKKATRKSRKGKKNKEE